MNKGGAVKTPQMRKEGGITQKAMMKMNKGGTVKRKPTP
jgi:hypothetical protein